MSMFCSLFSGGEPALKAVVLNKGCHALDFVGRSSVTSKISRQSVLTSASAASRLLQCNGHTQMQYNGHFVGPQGSPHRMLTLASSSHNWCNMTSPSPSTDWKCLLL